ncbi:tyrosine-type recombinase/integrase [Variovorax sp. OK605]|uniref:tyrosine-type recombinase/integrase n=1 Tax=Variovorax sp. OK605 TaxID=1855317 RepID=UPI000B875938|nr:tyrosine-type recombinase/integrase [Variovorax sp. OK605]
MRHVNYSLKPATINNAAPREKPYSMTDGGGLHIEVLPSGSKVWRYKYHLNGKREKVTIGSYPAFSIKQARDKHEEFRAVVERNESPARQKQSALDERRAAEARAVTFKTFAELWVDETLFYRSANYRSQTLRWLQEYVYPAIGEKALDEVEPEHVLRIIEKRLDTSVTAERIRVIIQQIFNYAIRKLIVKSNPATPLRGVVTRAPVKHHRHLNEKELAAFWKAVDRQGAHATTVAATKLLLLTMTRKIELLRAKWEEFDLEAGIWNIPASRMKMKKAHRVFLSTQAASTLQIVHTLTGHGDYVFPSIFRGGVPMGDVTLNHFVKRIDFGVPEFSPHGMRGTAATLLREHGFGRDVVELLLAHAEKSQVVAAYTHAEHAEERKRAMQFLADYIDQLAAT